MTPGPRLPHALRERRIVCFSTADWDTLLPTNKHHLMRRLAADNRVLFIETLGTRAPRLGQGADLARIGRRIARAVRGPVRRMRGLSTLSPIVRPAWGSSAAIELNRLAFRAQTARLAPRWRGALAWVYSPYAVYLLDAFQPRGVVYHMVDDLAAVPGADRKSLRRAEELMIAKADAVFCTEESLFDRARRINPRSFLMPNVADFGHFSDAAAGTRSATWRRMESLPRPRIVFAGNLAPHKVDLGLVGRLAKARPDWQFVLIGPSWEGAANAIPRGRNATALGHVAYKDLPAHLHSADVLVLPYARNAATRAVFPLKFFEYLSTGRPVVSSPLPSLGAFGELVEFAETDGEWLAALERALESPEAGARQRIALARRNTWERRIEEMGREVERILRP